MADLFSSVNQYATGDVALRTPLFDKAPLKGARYELAELPLLGISTCVSIRPMPMP